MKKIIVSTDCVADLPEQLRKKMDIHTMHYYIKVAGARFMDGFEMDSASLLRYIDTHEDFPKSSCASVEEYREYFCRLREEPCEGIVHISMGRYSSDGYDTAKKAAEDMQEVTVVDSGALSSSMAILALYAADLARRGCPLGVLKKALERKKEKLSTSFVVRDTKHMVWGGKINERVGMLLERLRLHPFCGMRGSRICLVGFFLGNERSYGRRYINCVLGNPDTIDPSLLFITTAGCTEEMKQWLEQEARKRVAWEKILFQEASATVSCNCGPGTFGLLFSRR